jgi:hypothetical protein
VYPRKVKPFPVDLDLVAIESKLGNQGVAFRAKHGEDKA